MKLVWKNNVYICTTKHADGYSEVRGFDRTDVLMDAIKDAFEDRADDGVEDFAPYEEN